MSFGLSFALTVFLVPAGAQAPAQARVIGHLAENATLDVGTLRFAANGNKLAYICTIDDVQHPVIGDTVGDGYDSVEGPVIDAKGEHVAFRVMTLDKKERESWTLLVDGKKVATDDWIGPVALSPIDGTPAYWSSSSWIESERGDVPGPGYLNFGKKKGTRWDLGDQVRPPAFSPDGRTVLSCGVKDGLRDEEAELRDAVAILDSKGKEVLLELPEVNQVAVHPNGSELLCTTVDLSKGEPGENDPVKHVVTRLKVAEKRKNAKDVILGASYDSAAGALYSDSGAHFAYVASRGEKVGVVIDDDEKAPCEYDVVDEIVFDPQGKQVAYVAVTDSTMKKPDPGYRVFATAADAEDGKWIVVNGGVKSDEFDRTSCPRWSPDGKRLAFAACKSTVWRVHVGDKSSEPFEFIGEVSWSKDGKSVWFGARRGREFSWNVLALD